MPNLTRIAAVTIACALVLPAAGCSRNSASSDTGYVARDVNTLYALAKQRLDQGDYEMAAQLFEAACRAEPAIPGHLGKGDFARLLSWLRQNVHGKASLLTTEELLVAATGRPLDAGTFRSDLRRRYVERAGAP